MTAERFLALVAAYGADARRWPESERAAAQAFAAAAPEVARAALAEADATDALLFAAKAMAPSMALRDRVIAGAAGAAGAADAGLKARRGRKAWIDRLAWAFGAGWAAAACAGVAAGVVLTSRLTADVQADAVLYQASLNGMDDTEVLG